MIKDELENLNDYASDITSADGTNGILIEIFKRLNINSGFCIEFGAADGVWNSNTNPFWSNGWEALLIEPDPEVFQVLLENTKEFDKVSSLNCFVSPYLEGENPRKSEGFASLDKILDELNTTKVNCDKNFDLLSIDVDGNDYHIWKNIKNYKPKCVVIEYNQTIPPNIDLVDEIQEYLGMGASIKSLEKLGREKGYSLVACTGSNLIFVDSRYIEKLGNITTNVKDLYDLKNLTCLVSTQKQDILYMTRRRPPNYYMTMKKYKETALLDLPEDKKIIKKYNNLYPVQVNYDTDYEDRVRILDGNMFFQAILDGKSILVYKKIESIKHLILENEGFESGV
jgi:hypothetical protein